MRYEFDSDPRQLIIQAPSTILPTIAVSTRLRNKKTVSDKPAKDLDPTLAFLTQFGLPDSMLCRATMLAEQNGTYGAKELITFSGIQEIDYYRLLSRHLNIRFVEAADIIKLVGLDDISMAAFVNGNVIWADIGEGTLSAVTAPDPRQITRLESMSENGTLNNTMVITAPGILRQMVSEKLKAQLTHDAINQLHIANPSASARSGANAWQGAFLCLLIISMVLAFTLSNGWFGAVFHLSLSVFFAACIGIRLCALADFRPTRLARIPANPDKDKPVYSVLVALHQESEVVPDLISSLKKLKWPRSKLEIKLVCEADDKSTIAALKAQELDPRFEIIAVPPSSPRTKPKALCYAFGFTSGQFITLYDAEDRPHPEQLLEAYGKFLAAGDDLACVQAPLIIANAGHNTLSSLFHFEYAGLFYALIPWLARRKAPIMLGGTSNHFRRDALINIGGWDPYNVTEDADIGMRLWRSNYYIDVITRPTLEDAPLTLSIWIPQRTRWFKGWMQTWLVHTKRPSIFEEQTSFGSLFTLNLLLTGNIASALLHPFVLIKAIYMSVLILSTSYTGWLAVIVTIDWIMLIISYTGCIAMCWRATEKPVRRQVGHRFLLTPVYWMGISFAAWRALFQLQTAPFKWEKTAHKRHEK